ncbi:MAG: homoserine O-succinyltransferase [Muribaculaceae bacterium]|nr:homoserine O-succinyltransferase [Muribaculaceae bacterium]
MPVLLSKQFCIDSDNRYIYRDGNPDLRIAIVNLMPLKQRTEDDFLRLVDHSNLNVRVDFVRMSSHVTKGADRERIERCYIPSNKLDLRQYDGLIVTGAPIEFLDFKEIDYWNELTALIDKATELQLPALYICWGAFAALYHLHGVNKVILDSKISGAYIHDVKPHALTRGLDREIWVPQSRNTTLDPVAISTAEVDTLITTRFNDFHMLADRKRPVFYFLGHWEYNPDTLHMEYTRDMGKGLNPAPPVDYYLPGKIGEEYEARWVEPGRIFYNNWLNYLLERKTNDR